MLFLILSGLATGASWLCYFKALQLGEINKVIPIDKSSTIITILLAFLFLDEIVSLRKIIAIIFLTIGTFLMIERKNNNFENEKSNWVIYAVGSAIFASLTSILAKIGISGIESNLGTAIRTVIVLIMAWFMVFFIGKQHTINYISKKELLFICLSGLATGASWLCYYKALQDGFTSVVVSIDKLSILVAILFSYFVFHECLSKKVIIGLILLIIGTIFISLS